MIILLIMIVVVLTWGIRLIRIDLKILKDENDELRKANTEMLHANYILTKKQLTGQKPQNKHYE